MSAVTADPPARDHAPGAQVATDALRPWARAWRIAVALAIGVLSAGMTIDALDRLGLAEAHPYVDLLCLDLLVVSPVLHIALWWHRRLPGWVTVLAQALPAAFPVTAGASLLLLASCATRRRWRTVVPASAVSVAATVAGGHVFPDPDAWPWWANAVGGVAGTALVVGWGAYLGARRDLVASWRWRAENAEAEQVRLAAEATRRERDRIAREMHDVLAHRLTQVSLHAGVLAYRNDLTAAQVGEQAETIRAASAAALDDLRAILGVLRSEDGATDDGAAAGRPQPTLADLPALLDQARRSGTPVTLADGLTTTPPDTLSRHAYRIVQEALTNASRHAPHAPVHVRVGGEPGSALAIRVDNAAAPSPAPRTPGSGLGLVGLRERATLTGGNLTAGPTRDGGWRVDAHLPWPEQEWE